MPGGSKGILDESAEKDGSPKHLNVYKPTFIINNSFAGGSDTHDGSSYPITKGKNPEDSIEQIQKKYRA
jgi:hypothetical protein